MNCDLEIQIQNYLDEINQHLPKEYPDKQRILNMIRNDLIAYLEEHSSAGFKDAEAEFGDVSEMIDSLMKTLPGAAIHTALIKKRQRQKILISLCVLLFIVLCFVGRYLYILDGISAVITDETISVYHTEPNIE